MITTCQHFQNTLGDKYTIIPLGNSRGKTLPIVHMPLAFPLLFLAAASQPQNWHIMHCTFYMHI
jgi:hypothetical protein